MHSQQLPNLLMLRHGRRAVVLLTLMVQLYIMQQVPSHALAHTTSFKNQNTAYITSIWTLGQKLQDLSIVLSRPRCVSSVTTQPLARTKAPSWCAFIGGQLLGPHALAGVCCCRAG